MTATDRHSLKGEFLIAMPTLDDPNFSHSVVCLCEHGAEGAMGLIVNRLIPNITAREIFTELKIDFVPELGDTPIHFGGPVHMNELFILHGPPLRWSLSLSVTPTLSVSNTRRVLEAIAKGEGPRSFLIALGCAGWGPDQLESEILENSWLNCPVFEDILFDQPVEDRWAEAVRRLGIDPALLTDASGHA